VPDVTKEHEVRHPSPFSALTLLVLFTERKMNLSQKQFDFYFDEVTAALERANNEVFRCMNHVTPAGDNDESEP